MPTPAEVDEEIARLVARGTRRSWAYTGRSRPVGAFI